MKVIAMYLAMLALFVLLVFTVEGCKKKNYVPPEELPAPPIENKVPVVDNSSLRVEDIETIDFTRMERIYVVFDRHSGSRYMIFSNWRHGGSSIIKLDSSYPPVEAK
jgi:hypothetical protein